MTHDTRKGAGRAAVVAALACLGLAAPLAARQQPAGGQAGSAAAAAARPETTQELNLRMQQILGRTSGTSGNANAGDYQIGSEDLLDISVLEAPDLSRTVRVSDDGKISLPLLGTVDAAELTSRELEAVLENLLRRSYMKNPHVSVFVKEMRSHPVSVFGAVEKPGVYQIREAKTLIEVLSMAQGLAEDAGDTAIVMRHAGDPASAAVAASPIAEAARALDGGAPAAAPEGAGPADPPAAAGGDPGASSVEISLKRLLDSGDPSDNVMVYPGDVVKVTRAGIVYVVGEVRKPGGFLLKTNENISVLQALALAEGLSSTAAGRQARIVTSSGASGARREVAIDLDKLMRGRTPDPVLHSRDILFVPTSNRKAAIHAVYRSAEGIAAAVSGAAVYRW